MAKKKTKKVKAVKEKNAVGRPSLYTPEMCDKVYEYIKETEVKGTLPTKVGFSLYLQVSNRVILNWAEKYPKFMRALETIDSRQKEKLINLGLKGDYNSTIVKLMLSSNHGMCERKHIEGDMAINVIIDQ